MHGPLNVKHQNHLNLRYVASYYCVIIVNYTEVLNIQRQM